MPGVMTMAQRAAKRNRISVMQGTRRVTGNPNVVFTTILGSCVTACLFDKHASVGGMNHFLLSEPPQGSGHKAQEIERYGVYAMEVLINDMLKAGAQRQYLSAHLYGGANLHQGMQAIGTANSTFATNFLATEGIPVIHASLGGRAARRVEFRPASGLARCRILIDDVVFEMPVKQKTEPVGELELF